MKNFYKHYSVFKERAASRFVLKIRERLVRGKKISYRLLRRVSRLFEKKIKIFFPKHFLNDLLFIE
jgi:hypothetical protein